MNTGETEARLVRWPITLAAPPVIAHAGIGVHGLHGAEHFRLPDLWCLHLYPYAALLRVGPHRFPIRPGCAGIIPPDVPIIYEYRERVQHLFVHFRCAADAGESQEQIAAMQDLGNAFARCYQELEEVVRDVHQPPQRLRARVWDLLLRLTDHASPTSLETPRLPPAVTQAVQLIELSLGEPLSLEQLARECGVSPSYLGRLFRQALGTTPVAYVRQRRVQRAVHLLHHSTLPIKTIAAACGLPDLHFFNKTLRRVLGHSPRSLRKQMFP